MQRWGAFGVGLVVGGGVVWGAMAGASSMSAGAATSSPSASPPALVSEATAPRPGEAPEATIARLRSQVAELEQQLDATGRDLQTTQMEGAVARGQLSALQGSPIAWPADVPDALRPEQFEADLRAAIAPMEGATVAEVDCSEYPCLAVVDVAGLTGDAMHAEVAALRARLEEGPWKALGEDMAAMMSVSSTADESGEHVILGIGAAAEGFDAIPDAQTRTRYRLDGLTEPR